MKSKYLLFGFLFIASVHASTTLNFLNVGPESSSSSTNVIWSSYAGAIGISNLVVMNESLAIGSSNTLESDDNENSSLAVGKFNYVTAWASIVGGYGNSASRGFSLTTGRNNVNSELNSLVIGESNITGYNRHHNGMLLGSYNAPVTKAAHLVIGNGYVSTPRRNSFIVYADGDIVITKPQGDISMGAYE